MSEVKFQLEEGKRYLDRRGRVFGPLIANGDDLFGESTDNYTWHKDGRVRCNRVYDIDLVAEYVEPVEDSKKWVELCDPEHVLRSGVDQYFEDSFNVWARVTTSAGKRIKDCTPKRKFRCRLEDLPQLTSCVLSTVKTEESPKPPRIEWYQHRGNKSVVLRVEDRNRIYYIEQGDESFELPYEAMKIHLGYQLTEDEAAKIIDENTPKPSRVVPSPVAPAPPVLQAIPVRLWTSHRVLFEGGDWPVRCGEQIPTGIGHHVEIKIGPNGFYVEKE